MEGSIKIGKKNIALSNRSLMIIMAVCVAFLILPLFLDDFVLGIAVRILIYILLVASMNIVNGYTGQFTVGQMGFASIGAYVTAISMTHHGWSFWSAVICAGIVASLAGALVSYPARKLSGLYLAVVTLGFSEIIRVIALNWRSVTGGALGISGIPSPSLAGHLLRTPTQTYYLVFIIVIIMYICTYCVVNSKIGRAWISIRENEAAAASLGINTHLYKALSFIYGAFWAGIAGSIMAIFYRYIDSTMFAMSDNFDILAMMIIGGQGTLLGPIVGSALVIGALEIFRFALAWRGVVFGAVIIFMMWIRPQGIMGRSKNSVGFLSKLINNFKAKPKGGVK